MTPYLIVANWKMNKSFTQTVSFCTAYHEELRQLSNSNNITLVLCPSFPALHPVAQLLLDTRVALGAQQCSAYAAGAYTGQVSAQSLKEVGCRYCIVGHSEQRAQGVTPEEVALQIARVFEQALVPIICIGETAQEQQNNTTFNALAAQLKPIMPVLTSCELPYAVAYEPVWSIGTGIVPTSEQLTARYQWLRGQIPASDKRQAHLLYGGSVDEHTIASMRKITEIEGFLIGNASLDFQKLKNIVSLVLS